jgi:uncharacterized DUF497 family protein
LAIEGHNNGLYKDTRKTALYLSSRALYLNMSEMDFAKRLRIEPSDFRLIIGRSQIDFDPKKEEINRNKHGYSLESAAYLLQRWLLPVTHSPHIIRDVSKDGEVRHEHIGIDDDGNVVFMVTTMRENETVRIISFRRASEEERNLFKYFTGYNKGVSGGD